MWGNICNSLSKNQKTSVDKHLPLPKSALLHLSEVAPMPQNHPRPNKVLVVDDDVRIRDLLRRYLMQEGFEVMLAEDGKALNRVLQRDAVDIIVLDLMMPGEDGLSICRRLRANGDRTPIIMLTAKSEDVDRIVGLEVGADDYLGKPFNPRNCWPASTPCCAAARRPRCPARPRRTPRW